MQVVGYVRVSTDDQATEGVSLSAQQAKIEAYCVVKDWTLVQVITDAGYSAKSLKRPGMERLLSLVNAEQVSAVIIYKLDRLTRSVSDLGPMMERLTRKRVALVSLQESLDQTTATGELMMNLLVSVSQWERKVIGERTRDAMRHMMTQRQCVGGIPYGWQRAADGVHLEPQPQEQVMLQYALQLKASGLSLAKIGAQLEAQGYLPRSGKLWHAKTVRDLLQAEVAA